MLMIMPNLLKARQFCIIFLITPSTRNDTNLMSLHIEEFFCSYYEGRRNIALLAEPPVILVLLAK